MVIEFQTLFPNACIKPYCFLKALNSTYSSIYLHDGETTRISRDGKVVPPTENPELIHVRVKPDIATKTLSAIYVNNFKGCWINDCTALCWYKYSLKHGHLIKLQAETFEYEIAFVPVLDESSSYLTLRIPRSLTEIPKKVMEEIVGEAKDEFWADKTKKEQQEVVKVVVAGGGDKRAAIRKKRAKKAKKVEKPKAQKPKKEKLKAQKSKTQKPKKQKVKKSKKPALAKKPKIAPVAEKETKPHVHFETRPKAEVQTIPQESEEFRPTASVQTDTYLKPSASLSRRVIFKSSGVKVEKSSTKQVKFVNTEGDSIKSVSFVEPEEQEELFEGELTKEEIALRVLDLYERMLAEEYKYRADKHFATYLIDRILRRLYKLKAADVKFIRDLLEEIVEDSVTMQEKDRKIVEDIVDEAVENVFIERRRRIEDGFFEKLLSEIFGRIQLTQKAAEAAKDESVRESSSSESSSSKSASVEVCLEESVTSAMQCEREICV